MLLLLTACVIETSLVGGKNQPASPDEEASSDASPETDTSTAPDEEADDTSSPDGTLPSEDTGTPEDTATPDEPEPSDDPCAAKACPDAPTLVDQDGNEYATVQLGDQCWMASNLRAGTYRNGDRVPVAPSDFEWTTNAGGVGYQATYDEDVANEVPLGKLYNGYAALDTRGICPEGWRVPSSEDFDILVQSVDPYAQIGEAVFNGTVSASAGGALKLTTGWNAPNVDATNSTCFNGAASGYKGSDGMYYNKGIGGYFWTTTDAWGGGFLSLLDRRLWNYTGEVIVQPNAAGYLGFPVRCVRE